MGQSQFQVASVQKRKRPSAADRDPTLRAVAIDPAASADRAGQAQMFTKAHLCGLLLSFMRRRGVTQADIARALGAKPPQLSAWLHATEPIPDTRLLALGEILGLSEKEMVCLTHASHAANRTDDLERLFIVQCRRSKRVPKSKQVGTELREHFRHPDRILGRLMAFAEKMVRNDCAIFGAARASKIIWMHVEAALRSCADLDSYVRAPDGENLFHEQNIVHHLRYPHHYYISFFLGQVSASDGPDVIELQATIFDALDACADLKSHNKPLQRRVAQHALHLLARYRGDRITSTRKSGDPETRRMEYFGEVYRLFDDGPFEELCQLIERDEVFADATLHFDASHYGDHWCAGDRVADAKIPAKALQRHIHGLVDPKASLRALASARLLNMVKRYGVAIRADRDVLAHLRSLRAFIEAIEAKGPAVIEAQLALLDLIKEREPSK